MRACDICHKKSLIQQSGAHQYGGGWAMRATKKRAVWMPNLHSVKVTYLGVRQTMRLCSKCVRRVKANMPAYHSKPESPTSVIATTPSTVIASSSDSLTVNSAKQSKTPAPAATA